MLSCYILNSVIGDLHDGAGLSDATDPNGVVSNVIWENIDYDILTIGTASSYPQALYPI